MTAFGKPVINKDELLELYTLIREDEAFTVRWNHVRGHAGIEGNEMADRLAREGAKVYIGGRGGGYSQWVSRL